MLISLPSLYVWFHEIIAELKDFVVLVYFGFPKDLLLMFYFERQDLSTKLRLASQSS